MSFKSTWAAWSEAFAIFAKYGEGAYSTQAEHDTVWAGPDAQQVEPADQERLKELGWFPASEGGWKKST